jgi:hypothetical protein
VLDSNYAILTPARWFDSGAFLDDSLLSARAVIWTPLDSARIVASGVASILLLLRINHIMKRRSRVDLYLLFSERRCSLTKCLIS